MKVTLSIQIMLCFAVMMVLSGCAGLNTDLAGNPPSQEGKTRQSIDDPRIDISPEGAGLHWEF